jgi:phosphomannomutase
MPAGLPIRFGTGGWRGVLGEDFTLPRARALAGAVADWALGERPGAPILVVHDTRFLADRVADEVAAALAARGAEVLYAPLPAPTPVACRAVLRRRCAAGVIVTASHNPPEYLGLKVVGAGGGPVARQDVGRLERAAAAHLAGSPPRGRPGGAVRTVEIVGPYLAELTRLLDVDVFRRPGLRVLYDALHGAGAGVLDRLLVSLGSRVALLRGAPDPYFGGGAPDPSPKRLSSLARALREAPGPAMGVATDGDADRFAALDGAGRRLSESESLALLVDHLARTRRLRGGLAISSATGSLVARVAESHGLRVERCGMGFEPLSAALQDGRAVLAGEESGGFAWAPFARDKDAILASALLVERAARERTPLRDGLRALRRRHGPSACGREALPAAAARGLARLSAAPPARFDGARVVSAETGDGLRLELADGGFVLWRRSGTEPVVRVYAEAASTPRLQRRLRAAQRLAVRASRRVLRTR